MNASLFPSRWESSQAGTGTVPCRAPTDRHNGLSRGRWSNPDIPRALEMAIGAFGSQGLKLPRTFIPGVWLMWACGSGPSVCTASMELTARLTAVRTLRLMPDLGRLILSPTLDTMSMLSIICTGGASGIYPFPSWFSMRRRGHGPGWQAVRPCPRHPIRSAF